jgi:hypothetical protein
VAKGKKQIKRRPTVRTERVKLTPDDSLKRMQAFEKRKEAFVAAVRKGKNRSVPA